MATKDNTRQLFTHQSKQDQEHDYEEEEDDDDDDYPYSEYFESIRSKTGLEIGVKVTWPNIDRPPFVLSTCLSEHDMAPMFHGTQWAGTRVWRAAVVALQYLLMMLQEEQCCSDGVGINITEDATLVEFGCGLGVPGMVLQAMTNCHVILTDKDSLVKQLRGNLKANFPNEMTNSRIQAQPLDWSVEGVQELLQTTGYQKGFDVVLSRDSIFEPLYGDSWKKLLECQEALLKVNPASYVLTSVERRRFDGIDKYLQALAESNVIARVEQVVPSFEYPREVELYRLYGQDNETSRTKQKHF